MKRLSPRTALVLCLVVAAAVRAVALAQFAGVAETHGDETYYVLRAQAIAAGEGHPGSYRPPGYPAFLALVFSLFENGLLAARVAQIGVSLVAVGAVYRIALARFGARAALGSGLACALAPALVHYPHFLWSECLSATVAVTLFWMLDAYERSPSLWRIALAGVWLGAAALVRETWVIFAPVVLVWIAAGGPWRRSLPRAALFGVCAALVVLPWTWRNYRAHEDFVLISTCRWYPIAIGNLGFEVEDERAATGETIKKRDVFKKMKRETRGMTELEREDYWRDVALETIGNQMPGWLIEKPARTATQLFSLRSQTLRFLTSRWLPDPGRGGAYALILTEVAGYLAVMILGLAGLWLAPGGRLKLLVVACFLFTLAIHVVANATTRFLVPLLPLLTIYVGPLVAGGAARGRWRRVGAAVTVLLFLVVVLSRWDRDVGAALEFASQIGSGG